MLLKVSLNTHNAIFFFLLKLYFIQMENQFLPEPSAADNLECIAQDCPHILRKGISISNYLRAVNKKTTKLAN